MKNFVKLIALAAFTLLTMNACCNSGSTADAILENIHYGKW